MAYVYLAIMLESDKFLKGELCSFCSGYETLRANGLD